MISKSIDIKCDSNKASLSESLCFYKGDKNVALSLSISNLKVNITRIITMLNLDQYSSINLNIVDPKGVIKRLKDLPLVEGRINWIITEDLTSELGRYDFQFILNEGESVMAIPPCGYDVLEPIAPQINTPYTGTICGEAICGEAICGEKGESVSENYEDALSCLSDDFMSRFLKDE